MWAGSGVRLRQRAGRAGRGAATGYLFKAVAAAWLGFAVSPSADPWLLVLPLLVWGFGGGIAGVPVMSVAMNVVGKRHAGMVGGTITSLASIGGGGVGTAVLGVLYKDHTTETVTEQAIATGASAVLIASAALAIVTTAVVLVLINV